MFSIAELLTFLNYCIYEYTEKVEKNKDRKIKKISIDTRKDCKESLFIPLKGNNFDGHDFVYKAFEKGAIASLTERELNEDYIMIRVNDCLYSLGEIAKNYREKSNIKTIGITGTAGKTTVKEIIGFLTDIPVPEENFNNLIGVPLTILERGKKDSYLILELGTNTEGEIKRLTEISEPEYVLITGIGFAHIEGFGSPERYAKEKLRILQSPKLKKAVVNCDSEFIKKFIPDELKEKIIFYSADQINNFKQYPDHAEYQIELDGVLYNVKSNLFGFHNAVNFLGVLTLLKELKFDLNKAIEKFEKFKPVKMRFEVIDSKNGYKIINDCYNANFNSFLSAIDTLETIECNGKKILVAGDMLELGDYSTKLHTELGNILSKTDFEAIICIGDKIFDAYKSLNKNGKIVKYFSNKDEAVDFIKNILDKGDLILFKASRKLRFEEIIEKVK